LLISCLNQCTYCKTKHARGDLASYSIEELVERARQSFQEGVCELWLTSEDLGAWGHDFDCSLPQLLGALVKIVPAHARMRLGMCNPPYILSHLYEIAEVLNHPAVYAFLHIPVQSGSDAVLNDMRREYTVDDFKHICDYLLERVPGLTIATDIICGFPTETAEDFEQTMQLIERYRFSSLFINQFYPRPGTPAAKMKRIETAEVKRRTKAASDLFRSYCSYADRVGHVYDVLVTETASDGQHLVAHNSYYEQILLPLRNEWLGRWLKVRIVAVSKFSMMAEVIDDGRDGTFRHLSISVCARVLTTVHMPLSWTLASILLLLALLMIRLCW